MKKILRYWRGVALGVLATFATTPVLADIASDQKDVFGAMLSIFIVVCGVAGVVVGIRNHKFKTILTGVVCAFIGFIIVMYFIDVW